MLEQPKQQSAVFLDRDGVIIEESRSYITRIEHVRILPGVAAAIRALNDEQMPVIVVTNQSALARGMLTKDGLDGINVHIKRLLAAEAGARIDALYYCPYHPEGTVLQYRRNAECRKPKPGMLVRAAKTHGLTLDRCFLVGDKESDMIAAKAVGCGALTVCTSEYALESSTWVAGAPDAIFPDLQAAVEFIIRQRQILRS